MRMPRFFRRPRPAAPDLARTPPPVTVAEAEARATREAMPTRSRRYMAARPDRLVGGWQAFGRLASQRVEARLDIRGLIAHARFAAQNIDYVRGFELMTRRNVIGPRGIRLQSDARREDGTPDNGARAAIESAWTRWGQRGSATICGRLSWWNVECMAATMLAREGNFLLRMRTGPGFGPFGFQVEVVPFDLLDIDLVQTLAGGRYVDGGIEFDADGKPLAAHLFTSHPGEYHTGASPRRIRVPWVEIVHLYRVTEPGQVLGVPATHTALRRLNMISKYEQAALTAAHFGAAAMAFLKSAPEEDGPPEAAPEDGEGPDDLPAEVEAGMFARLPPGADIASWTPNYPDGEMPEFVAHMLRGASSGMGVAYASLASDLRGANFSSLRAGLGEEREEWRMAQRDLVEGLHSQVFAAWLPLAILSGQISLPWSGLDRWRLATWRPKGWPSVNPKDDATAAEADLRNRLRAPSAIVAERGEDFQDVVARYAADVEILRAAGLPLPEAMTAPAPPAAAPAPPDPEEEGGPAAPG